jgi:hypothetical protein
MIEYLCPICGAVIQAESEVEAMAEIAECEEYF